jgi:LysM repeat protein
MSKKYTAARHRAATTPTTSLALTIGRPALVVAAASGLFFGFSAPAHAGVSGPDNSGTGNVQAQSSAPVAAVAPAPAPATANVHTVVSGDTLGEISAANGVALNDVLAANGLALSSIIYPGDQIQIPAAGQAAPAAAPAPAAAAPQVDMAKVKQLLALGLPDQAIAIAAGTTEEAVAAIRNMP